MFMKISLPFLLSICLFIGCAKTQEAKPTVKNTKPEAQKVLVVFFSKTGDNYGVGSIKVGNTHKVAQEIARQTNGTLFEIKPAKPYPDAYKACTEVAQEEFKNNARPKIKGYVEGITCGHNASVYVFFPSEVEYSMDDCDEIHRIIVEKTEFEQDGKKIISIWKKTLRDFGIRIRERR